MANAPIATRVRPIIRVFVSSTFSDLKQERNALQAEVFPALEKFCLDHGFQFQAIDLRWGVPAEAGLDHRTMRICFEELRRSQAVSPQPNFLILLGNRYGWRPLPEGITKAEYDRLARIAKRIRGSTETILSHWYQEDKNFHTGNAEQEVLCYILQSRQRNLNDGRNYGLDPNGEDTQDWKNVQKILWDLINEAFPPSELVDRFTGQWDECRAAGPTGRSELPQIVRFQASATEQEIWCGALSQPDAHQHVFAVDRRIENLEKFVGHLHLKDFVDLDQHCNHDHGPSRALDELKSQLEVILGNHNIIRATGVELSERMDARGELILEVTSYHIKRVCEELLGKLKAVIQRQIDDYWGGAASRSSREWELEQQAHDRFGHDRAPENSFIGRDKQLSRIAEYIAGDDNSPLVIHGPSGSGKTALMARAVQNAREEGWKPIVRFLGATPQSSAIRSLLTDLCIELRACHTIEADLPTEFQSLVQEFYEHLDAASVETPIVLFLDALDQLDDADGGRQLTWLRSMPLSKHAKLVVSCVSDVPDDDVAGESHRALAQRQLLRNSVPLDMLSSTEAQFLLFHKWLPSVGRRVSDAQRAVIEERILPEEASACRSPLYLKILFEECRLWPSYRQVNVSQLGHNVDELLRALFDRLCDASNHGLTVYYSMTYIASARRGLTETELLDVLHLEAIDPNSRFGRWFVTTAHHELPAGAKQLPLALWSRLRYDLAPYLTEYASLEGNTLNFYHGHFRVYICSRFLNTPNARYECHKRLATYFRALSDPNNDGTWNSDRVRPMTELPYHLFEVGRSSGNFLSLLELLKSNFIDEKLRHTGSFELVNDDLYLGFQACELVDAMDEATRIALRASSIRAMSDVASHAELILAVAPAANRTNLVGKLENAALFHPNRLEAATSLARIAVNIPDASDLVAFRSRFFTRLEQWAYRKAISVDHAHALQAWVAASKPCPLPESVTHHLTCIQSAQILFSACRLLVASNSTVLLSMKQTFVESLCRCLTGNSQTPESIGSINSDTISAHLARAAEGYRGITGGGNPQVEWHEGEVTHTELLKVISLLPTDLRGSALRSITPLKRTACKDEQYKKAAELYLEHLVTIDDVNRNVESCGRFCSYEWARYVAALDSERVLQLALSDANAASTIMRLYERGIEQTEAPSIELNDGEILGVLTTGKRLGLPVDILPVVERLIDQALKRHGWPEVPDLLENYLVPNAELLRSVDITRIVVRLIRVLPSTSPDWARLRHVSFLIDALVTIRGHFDPDTVVTCLFETLGDAENSAKRDCNILLVASLGASFHQASDVRQVVNEWQRFLLASESTERLGPIIKTAVCLLADVSAEVVESSSLKILINSSQRIDAKMSTSLWIELCCSILRRRDSCLATECTHVLCQMLDQQPPQRARASSFECNGIADMLNLAEGLPVFDLVYELWLKFLPSRFPPDAFGGMSINLIRRLPHKCAEVLTQRIIDSALKPGLLIDIAVKCAWLNQKSLVDAAIVALDNWSTANPDDEAPVSNADAMQFDSLLQRDTADPRDFSIDGCPTWLSTLESRRHDPGQPEFLKRIVMGDRILLYSTYNSARLASKLVDLLPEATDRLEINLRTAYVSALLRRLSRESYLAPGLINDLLSRVKGWASQIPRFEDWPEIEHLLASRQRLKFGGQHPEDFVAAVAARSLQGLTQPQMELLMHETVGLLETTPPPSLAEIVGGTVASLWESLPANCSADFQALHQIVSTLSMKWPKPAAFVTAELLRCNNLSETVSQMPEQLFTLAVDGLIRPNGQQRTTVDLCEAAYRLATAARKSGLTSLGPSPAKLMRHILRLPFTLGEEHYRSPAVLAATRLMIRCGDVSGASEVIEFHDAYLRYLTSGVRAQANAPSSLIDADFVAHAYLLVELLAEKLPPLEVSAIRSRLVSIPNFMTSDSFKALFLVQRLFDRLIAESEVEQLLVKLAQCCNGMELEEFGRLFLAMIRSQFRDRQCIGNHWRIVFNFACEYIDQLARMPLVMYLFLSLLPDELIEFSFRGAPPEILRDSFFERIDKTSRLHAVTSMLRLNHAAPFSELSRWADLGESHQRRVLYRHLSRVQPASDAPRAALSDWIYLQLRYWGSTFPSEAISGLLALHRLALAWNVEQQPCVDGLWEYIFRSPRAIDPIDNSQNVICAIDHICRWAAEVKSWE